MKRLWILLGCFLGAFVLVALVVSFEVAGALFFGWVPFLSRVLSQISPSRDIVAVSSAAVILFAAGVHWLGWTSYRSSERKWRLRWTFSIVTLVFLLFGAGTAMIGIVHQTGWLLSAEEPLTGTTLKPGYHSSSGNLKEFGIGFHDYAGFSGSLPPGGSFLDDGRAKHSWETYLLPYLNYAARDIDLNTPWNDAKNRDHFKSVLPEFINPDFRTADIVDADGYALSHYAANVRVLGPNRAVAFKDMANGTGHTILVGEVNANFKPWGDPVNWRDPAKGINSSPNGFGGPRSAHGANFLMADGSVRFFSEKTDPRVLKALSDPANSAPIDLDW
jgi:prepilin-type processing-associated H-X9-DG protein